MPSFLIVYSSHDGQTLKICRKLQALLEQQAHQVTLVSIEDADRVDLQAFDKIVIGAGIRYGHHHPQVFAFVKRHQALLDSKPNAFFSVNLVARKPEKRQPETNPYLRKFLKRIRWKPKQLAVFAGKLDYPRYNALDRNVIRMIMWITGGPTDPSTTVEFTDWQQVTAFAESLSRVDNNGSAV